MSQSNERSILLTLNEVQREYRISPATAYRMMADGRLKSVRLAGRRLVPRDVLEQMIGSQLADACEPA